MIFAFLCPVSNKLHVGFGIGRESHKRRSFLLKLRIRLWKKAIRHEECFSSLFYLALIACIELVLYVLYAKRSKPTYVHMYFAEELHDNKDANLMDYKREFWVLIIRVDYDDLEKLENYTICWDKNSGFFQLGSFLKLDDALLLSYLPGPCKNVQTKKISRINNKILKNWAPLAPL